MKFKILLACILLVHSITISANGYVGFSVGSTNVKVDLTVLGEGNIDETTALYKYYGGYKFNRYLALEGAFFDLASASVGSIDTSTGTVSGSVDMKAFGLYGVAFVPLTKSIRAYIKAGAANWDADLTRDAETASADGTDALYGLGVSYNFTKTFAITADWEVIDSPNPEFSTVSLGFKWDFK